MSEDYDADDQQKCQRVCEMQFGQNKKKLLLQRHVNSSWLADHFGLPNVETEPMIAFAEVAVTVGKPLVEGEIHSGGRSCKMSHSNNTQTAQNFKGALQNLTVNFAIMITHFVKNITDKRTNRQTNFTSSSVK